MNDLSKNFEDDAKKYFDEKKYRTLIIGKDGIKNPEEINEVLMALAENNCSTEEREEFLRHLKASNPKKHLIDAINREKDNAKKARLIATCWEVDVDCTDEFLFFVRLTCVDDFNVALEALTVIENIENEVPMIEVEEAKKIVSEKVKQKTENIDLLVDLLDILKHK